MIDDDQLIDELHAGLRERAATIDAPAGLAASARTGARRRRNRRAVLTGVPVIAAAAVAAGLAVGSGDSAPTTALGRESADIVRHVEARLAAGGIADDVYEVQSPGATGPGSGTLWGYVNPRTGVWSVHSVDVIDGRRFPQEVVNVPVGRGRTRMIETSLNPSRHVYSVYSNVGATPPGLHPGSPEQIRSALSGGRATKVGTATVAGHATIELRLAPTRGSTTTLYVDSRTFEPVREVTVDAASATMQRSVIVDSWRAPTAANLARTRLGPIPAGYRRVSALSSQMR